MEKRNYKIFPVVFSPKQSYINQSDQFIYAGEFYLWKEKVLHPVPVSF